MLIQATGKVFYKYRGDVELWDYTKTQLVKDSSYHTMDLSDVIGKGTGTVRIRVRLQHSQSGDNSVLFRRNGNVNELNLTLLRAPVGTQNYDFYIDVENDVEGKIEYQISDTPTWNILRLVVQSWVK